MSCNCSLEQIDIYSIPFCIQQSLIDLYTDISKGVPVKTSMSKNDRIYFILMLCIFLLSICVLYNKINS